MKVRIRNCLSTVKYTFWIANLILCKVVAKFMMFGNVLDADCKRYLLVSCIKLKQKSEWPITSSAL